MQAALPAPDALAQEVILQGQFGDDSPLPPALLVDQVFLPVLECLSASRQEGAALLAEVGG